MSALLRDDERAHLRDALEARMAALRAEIEISKGRARSERIGKYAGEVHDRGEESSTDAAAEVNDALIDQQQAELRAVRLALARIEDGSYGDCVECGRSIGLPRLQVNPSAARCVPCQESSEGG